MMKLRIYICKMRIFVAFVNALELLIIFHQLKIKRNYVEFFYIKLLAPCICYVWNIQGDPQSLFAMLNCTKIS